MRWILTVPFLKGIEDEWIHRYVSDPNIEFSCVIADYAHERSRQATSLAQWGDYLRHAARSWFSVAPWSRVGFISAFPQLPVMLGIIKRLTFSKRPIIAWMFNLGQTYGGLKGSLARFGLQSINLFVVHSQAEIESYSKWLRIPPERFIFVPLSIKMDIGTEAEDEIEPFIFAMGTAHRDYRLLFEVVDVLGYKTIVVAGAHALSGLVVPPNVTVMSNLSLQACHRLCQHARVNVVPVDNAVTASGQVTLLETMMHGKAVVATHCVGTVDYLVDGITGLTVKAADAAEFTNAISKLWNDRELRVRLGTAAQKYIQKNVSFAGVAEQMHKLIERLQ